MSVRARRWLLGSTAVVVIAFAIAVRLDQPSRRMPANSQSGQTSTSTSSGQTPGPPRGATSSAEFEGAALAPDTPAHTFTLTDQSGRRRSLSSYRGQTVVLAFLYTDCGATCVLVAQQIRGALGELAHPVPVLIVSVDPSADTPARIARFLSTVSLQRRARYLSGSPTQLRSLWRAYGVVPASAGRSAFDRSASVFLIDPRGNLRVLFQPEQLTPESLAHDIGLLQSGQ